MIESTLESFNDILDKMKQGSENEDLMDKICKTTVGIDIETYRLHNMILRTYSTRFPGLRDVGLLPINLASLIQSVGDRDNQDVNLSLILPSSVILDVSMGLATKTGPELEGSVLSNLMEDCKRIVELDKIRRRALTLLEQHIAEIAPNLTMIVGSRIASELIALVGGLNEFSIIPAGNVQFLGKSRYVSKNTLNSYSKKNRGLIVETDIVQSVPSEYQNQLIRLVSGKCSLASRMDVTKKSSDGKYGEELRQMIMKRIDMMTESPLIPRIKPLPVPKEHPKARRGGKRVRRFKETFAMTEYRRLQNRIKFGTPEPEVIVGDTVKGLGMLKNTGKLYLEQDTKLRKYVMKSVKKRLDGISKNSNSMHSENTEPISPERCVEYGSKYFDLN
jgi:U4/U6 small nuclear ribonucleoprotein PRP31